MDRLHGVTPLRPHGRAAGSGRHIGARKRKRKPLVRSNPRTGRRDHVAGTRRMRLQRVIKSSPRARTTLAGLGRLRASDGRVPSRTHASAMSFPVSALGPCLGPYLGPYLGPCMRWIAGMRSAVDETSGGFG
ncbi:hypothetical protein A33M_2876 [Rhodovulum sp. PH10]|nr:hypothetical protein A33M_2876 [Rhodovulum sp. PH10]